MHIGHPCKQVLSNIEVFHMKTTNLTVKSFYRAAAKSAAALMLAVILLFGVALGSACNKGTGVNPPKPPVVEDDVDLANIPLPAGVDPASARDDIIRLIEDSANGNGEGRYGQMGDQLDAAQNLGNEALEAASPGATKTDSGDYAKTNVQTEGVDEGDIIKVDDGYIYKLSSAGLVIVDVKQMKVASKLEYENFVPVELYVLGDKLIVIGGVYQTYHYTGSTGMADMICYSWVRYEKTRVGVYDIANRAAIKVLNEYDISGYFLTSRLIDSRLVVAVNHTFYIGDRDAYFPRVNDAEIGTDSIYLYQTSATYYHYRNFVVIASIDLNTAAIKMSAHLGLYGWETMYVSKDFLYVFNSDYSGVSYEYGEVSYYCEGCQDYHTYQTVTRQIGVPRSKIFKISLKTLKCTAAGVIDGVIYDRYYADEYEGNLRVVSYVYAWEYAPEWANKSYTAVHVLDKSLEVLGGINDIAVGESIYSVRFNKTQGTIVTFLQIDPLFKLDLSDPKNPTISAGLKEEGVNTYLQYLSDDVILGLGLNAVDNGWGGTTLRGMKIALYDNTGEDAVNINTIAIGEGYSYSEALYNPKAIVNDTAKKMFAFPVELRTASYYNLQRQGLAVFEYDLAAKNDADKLVYRGILSDLPDNLVYKDWYDYYDYYHSYISRGARIGDKIYTVSDKYVTSYDLATLAQADKIQIAEFQSARQLFGW